MKLSLHARILCLLIAMAMPWYAWADDGDARAPAKSDLADVQRGGKLTMLCWPHQESSFVRRMVAEYGEQGLNRYTGIDVEILRGFADTLGASLDVRPMKQSFAELIPALLAGDGHLIGSSLTITERRAEKIDFSTPYHWVKKVVIVRRGSKLASVADFAGRTASVVAGSSHEEHLLALGLKDLEILHTGFTFENYTEVAEGRADFTVVDSGFIDRVLAQNPEIADAVETAFVFPRDDEYGFAGAPGSDLVEPLNAYLTKLRESGELDKITARHIRPEN